MIGNSTISAFSGLPQRAFGGVSINLYRKTKHYLAIGSTYPKGNNWTFGYVINADNTVSIWNGRARRSGEYNTDGTNKTWVTPTAETVVTFTGDGANQRIIWQWDPSGGLVILTTPQVNDPSDAPPIIYGIVAQFDVTNGVPKLSIAGGCSDQLGHLLILPMFAPGST